MAEQTNPADIDLGVASQSIEDRMAAFVNNDKALSGPDQADPPQDAAQQDAPQDQADGELTVDDLPEDESVPQSAGETVFEIVHNGQTHKITSREEQIKYMQQGFDYTQKTQAVADKARQLDASLQRSQALEQMAPLLTQDLATVKAIEAQLQQYSKVDWVRLATEEPLDYPKYRAQYDLLVQGYQQAAGQFQQKVKVVTEERQAIAQAKLQAEREALIERIPEWRDPAKYQAGAQELASYLVNAGADPGEVATLSDSLAVSIARKAMLYDKLVSAKAGKVKQLRTIPPVPKPGAATPATAEGLLKARDVHRKVGSRESAANLLLTRMKG